MPLAVVCGVSGSGKSTVGALLAERLGVPFVDADDLHPITNLDKMRAGVPLTDDDRWPWLRVVGETFAAASDSGLVIACSALRRSYREAIETHATGVQFVMLDGSRELLAGRLGQREGHFMPATLLDSQLATLEALADDEPGVTVSIEGSPDDIAAAAQVALAKP